MADEHAVEREDTNDEIFANEVTPLGVTKPDQVGPRAEHEAAISGSWAPGPGSGPEGIGGDLGSYPGGPHAKGEGPDTPDNPTLGGKRTARRADTMQAAGKMTRKPHGAEEEEAHGPKTFGHPEAYAMDDQRAPYEDTHEGHLSSVGGSSGSGGGEQILDDIAGEQELDQTQRARPPRPYPSSVEPVPDDRTPGQPEPGEPLMPGGKDAIAEPEANAPGA